MMGFAHGWGVGGYGMHSISGGIFMVLLWVLIIIGIVYLLKNINNTSNTYHNNNNKEDKAINIARERYAKGEISKEEFNELLKSLRE